MVMKSLSTSAVALAMVGGLLSAGSAVASGAPLPANDADSGKPSQSDRETADREPLSYQWHTTSTQRSDTYAAYATPFKFGPKSSGTPIITPPGRRRIMYKYKVLPGSSARVCGIGKRMTRKGGLRPKMKSIGCLGGDSLMWHGGKHGRSAVPATRYRSLMAPFGAPVRWYYYTYKP